MTSPHQSTNRKLQKGVRTYWTLLLAEPWPEFARQARGRFRTDGKASEAIAHRKALEAEFGTDAVEREIVRQNPRSSA